MKKKGVVYIGEDETFGGDSAPRSQEEKSIGQHLQAFTIPYEADDDDHRRNLNLPR